MNIPRQLLVVFNNKHLHNIKINSFFRLLYSEMILKQP